MKQIKTPFSEKAIQLPIYPVMVGGTNDQRMYTRGEGASEWHIFFTEQGSGEMEFDNNTVVLTPENLVIIKANEPHGYMPVKPNKWETRWIVFSGKDIDNLMETLGITKTTVIDIADREFLQKKFYFLLNMSENGYDAVTASSVLYATVCEITKWHSSQTELLPCDAINRAVFYITRHYGDIFTLNDLATYSRVSKQYLCRLFQKYFKMRPFEYINKIRIEKAQEFLMQSNMKIHEISKKCCFDSPAYFTKKFKQYTGVSPSQFLKFYKA